MTIAAIIFMIVFNACIITTVSISLPVLLKNDKNKNKSQKDDRRA